MLYLFCIISKLLFLTICLFSKNIESRYYLIESSDTVNESNEYRKSTIKNMQDYGESSVENPKLPEGNFKSVEDNVKFSPHFPSEELKEHEKFLNEMQQRRPGSKLVEGDMILDKKQQKTFGHNSLNQDYNEEYNQATKDSQWPNNKLFYTFHESVKEDMKEYIKIAVNDLAEKLKGCITFEEEDNVNQIIIKQINNGTCASDVGTIHTGKNYIYLDEYECSNIPVIQHEFIHALGIFHQHSRWDRDDYLTVKWKNIETHPNNMTHNFDKQENADTFNLPYDYSSIMHYDKYSFSKKKDWPPLITIKTKDPKNENLIGRQLVSPQDILQIKLFYGCGAGDCHDKKGNEKKNIGYMRKTKSGLTCQKWSSQYPHKHIYNNVGHHNYCRFTNGYTRVPWCYTINRSKRWEYCHIPVCGKKGKST